MFSRISSGVGPILLLAVLAVAVAAPAHAEARVDLVPSLAYVNPTANVIDEAGSSLDGQVPGAGEGSIDATLFYGSAQIAIGLGAEKRFLLHGGIGMQGTSYDELIEGGNIMTGVIGFGGWAPLSESVALRADLDVHVHTTYFEFGDLQTQELTQYDVIASIGL